MLVQAFDSLMGLVALALFVFKVLAFVDSLRHPEGAYPAAAKQTKTRWVVLLGASASLQFFFYYPIGLFSVLGTIVTIIYVVDVRPAVKQTGGRGGQASGPYGPW
ncbi:MAG: DUF2516 family protein [Actinomycetes bacterium]